MEFIMFLIFVLIITITVFSILTIRVVKENNFLKVVKFFERYLIFIFAILFILYIFSTILTGLYIKTSELLAILFYKYMIHFIFFIKIYIDSKSLLNNLKNNNIFVYSNSKLTRQIGLSFIYLAIIEIIAGLVLGIIRFSNATYFKDFRFQTNTTLVLFLVIGFILLIVSSILQKAIEIYKEHNLTI